VPDPGISAEKWVAWIERVIRHHNAQLGELQYIFCSDDYLHRLNVEHLQHDTLTDIITFPYADPPLVSGDIFISTERVADNASDLDIPFDTELRRVLIHGVLHLCGFPDKQPEEAARMRGLEEEALELYP
jgi:rRNA maturation RNase YbeY